jgi:hypothetical protein
MSRNAGTAVERVGAGLECTAEPSGPAEDEAIQANLDWEFGLVEQPGRDGTYGVFVI